MPKMITAVLACLVPAFAACAQPAPTTAQREGVASAVARYVNAIACAGVRITPDDVMMLVPPPDHDGLGRFAVLWHGDLACFGGSGSEKTHLAIATFNTGQYVVQPELSSPVVAFESPVRFVSRVVSYSARILVLEGKEYGPGDPNVMPSVPVRFILRRDDLGNWRLVDKIFLARTASGAQP